MRSYVAEYQYIRQLFYTYSDKEEIELPISDWLDGLQKTVRASIQSKLRNRNQKVSKV